MDEQAVAAVAALDDPVRAALYQYARASDGPVTREDAARAVGISRKLAAFHLDKLVACRLLRAAPECEATARRVGRAPKRYEPTAGVSVQVPQREHDMLADILLDAVLEPRAGEAAAAAVLRVARDRGTAIGADERQRSRPGRLGAERALGLTQQILDRHGFEPAREPHSVRLRNCPFHPLAAKAPDLVCGLNREFVAGIVDGLHAEGVVDAVLAPHAGACCVEIRGRLG